MQNPTSLPSNSFETQRYSPRSDNVPNPSPSPLRNLTPENPVAWDTEEGDPLSLPIPGSNVEPGQFTEWMMNRTNGSRPTWTSSMWYRRKFRAAKSYGSMRSVHCVESCIRVMDQMHNSNFQDWIQDPRNAEYVAGRLRPIVAEYDLARAACALQWLCKSWTSYECLALFRRLTKDWNVKDQKALADQLVKNDNLKQPASCGVKRTVIARPTTECECACRSNWSRTRRYRSRESSPSSAGSSPVTEFNYQSRDPMAEFARETQTGSGDEGSQCLTNSIERHQNSTINPSDTQFVLPPLQGTRETPNPSRNGSNVTRNHRVPESSLISTPFAVGIPRRSASHEGFTAHGAVHHHTLYASPDMTMSCRRQKSNESLNEFYDRRGGESLSDLTFAEMFDRQNQDMQL